MPGQWSGRKALIGIACALMTVFVPAIGTGALADHVAAPPCSFPANTGPEIRATSTLGPGLRFAFPYVGAKQDRISWDVVPRNGDLDWVILAGDAPFRGHLYFGNTASPSAPTINIVQDSPYDRLCFVVTNNNPSTVAASYVLMRLTDNVLE